MVRATSKTRATRPWGRSPRPAKCEIVAIVAISSVRKNGFIGRLPLVGVSRHEPGGGANTQRRDWSGLRQIQILPSGLGVASSNGTNSVPPTIQPFPVTAIWSVDLPSASSWRISC